MSKTKIVATVGPSSSEKDTLKEMIYNGMDVVRLNMTHATHSFCDDIIRKINELNKELDTNVAIMMDLQGPDICINKIEDGEAELVDGEIVRIYMDDRVGNAKGFSTNYHKLLQEVKYNTTIKIDDGKIELEVIDKEEDALVCRIIQGGMISSHKTLNVIDTMLDMPFLSEKDKDDLAYANDHNIDYVALSFVTSAEDVLEVNDMLIDFENNHMGIIAKVEAQQALDEIDEIIRVSDGVMIARGDLGVSIPMERIPGIQKSIISKCHIAGKISIVATEMLSSMENSMRPTRAEVSDVANAVLDGVDAVMLSGETTIGIYPVETLGMMEKIIVSAEEDISYYDLLDKAMRTEKQDITGSIAYSVTECANRLKCKAILAPTMSGYTARKMSRFRPSCPIIAMSPDRDTVKSLALYFGVQPVYIKDFNNFDKLMDISVKTARQYVDMNPGDRIIITGGYPFHQVKHTNFMKIEQIES